MEVLSITGPRTCALTELPTPHARDDYAVVQVQTAPLCTEYKMYAQGTQTDCLGHEAAGIVAEIAQPGSVQPGNRVVVMPQYSCGRCALCLRGDFIYCRNGGDPLSETGNTTGTAAYAQFLLKPARLLVSIPDDISTDHASLACCGLGPTFGAMQKMQVDAFDTVLILGLGPVGLGGIINAVFRGARVIAVESQPYRTALAKTLGAAAVIDPRNEDGLAQILDLTEGRGVDKALECSGVPQAQRLMLDAVRRKGQAAFIAESGEFTVHISPDLLRKGLTLHGQWHYNLGDTPRMMHMIRQVGPQLDLFITHTFSLDHAQEAFELQMTGNCGKVLLHL